jgi:small-conductance mechanosensitive channel
MEHFLQRIIGLPLGEKFVCAAFGTVLIHAVFRLLERTLPRNFRERDARYRVRKFIVFAGYAVVMLFVTILFEDRLGRVSIALGVAGAGVVVALQDVIASFAGWFAIGLSNLYAVGHRIQVGETKGDVIDISIMRTTVMETGSWVSKDLYSGRVVRIPNSYVLKGPVFNYSQGFRFVWDEIKVPLTAGSDQHLAREMLLRVAKETVAGYLTEAENSWKKVADNYRLENPSLEPTVSLAVNAGSLEFTLSYVVDYTNRTSMKDRLFTSIVEEVAKSNGRLIWATTSGSSREHSATVDATAPQAFSLSPQPMGR